MSNLKKSSSQNQRVSITVVARDGSGEGVVVERSWLKIIIYQL